MWKNLYVISKSYENIYSIASFRVCTQYIAIYQDIMLCGCSVLWPFRPVAVLVCGLSVCGRSGLWPFRSVAVSVCGRSGLWLCRLWQLWPVTYSTTVFVSLSAGMFIITKSSMWCCNWLWLISKKKYPGASNRSVLKGLIQHKVFSSCNNWYLFLPG